MRIYLEEGLTSLLKRTQAYIRYSTRSYYQRKVESLQKFTPGQSKQIELNGVIVPICVSWIDKYVPYYDPPYPTENSPLYEHTEGEAIRQYCEEGDDVVIIGGGLGVTTVIASRIAEKVTVFEQSKDTYKILKRTVEANDDCNTVTLHCAGVGTTGGSNLTHGNPSEIDIVPPAELPYADVYEMDCEGAETTILRNMDVRPRTLLIETHSNHDEVVDILESMGYTIAGVVRDGKGQHHSCTHVRAKYTGDTPS